MIYNTIKGDLRAKIYQKFKWESVIRFFFAMRQKYTYRQMLPLAQYTDTIRPKMQ